MTSVNILKQSKGIQLSNERIKILLNGCIVNERAAQKELYSKYFGYVMSVALLYGNSYYDAVEITNSAFLKAYKSVKFFLPTSDNTVALFTGWLRGMVLNTAVDYIRKFKKNGEFLGGNMEQFVIADSQETVEQMLQHNDIINCIQRLPMAYKAVFNLHVIEGLSHAEIADKLDISEEISISTLHKARRTLKQLLIKGNLISYDRTLVSVNE